MRAVLVVAVVVSLLLCLSLLLLASRWFRMWFALHKFSCPIGSPNYAASGWFRMWCCAHPVPHREPQLVRQWVVSYVVLRPHPSHAFVIGLGSSSG